MKPTEYIKYLQKEYYEGNPVVSNEEYDALALRFGEEGIGEGGEFPHLFRMYSLDKVYPSRGDDYPLPLSKCIKTPKLDGCAISTVYLNHNLVQGNTRGDGITSPTTFEDWKLRALGIPKRVSTSNAIQITGEVVITKDVSNKRNYASGAMQLQEEEEFLQRVVEGGLIFVAYNVQESEAHAGILPTYEQDMRWVSAEGFNTILDGDFSNVPQDGTVYRLNSNKEYFQAGFTHKHPKGAFAEKEDEEGVPSTLLEVIWQTGKTGKVTPVAIFEEIVIDDAKINRATLNNVGYIEALDLEIGDTILVIRSGGVIPKIIGKL